MTDLTATRIDQFIERRWRDAKEVLRGLVPEFVARLEGDLEARDSRLFVQTPAEPDTPPRRRLPKKWHLLLESCDELNRQSNLLKAAGSNLTASANSHMKPAEAGASVDYHLRSWVIHASALVERGNDTIRKTVELYLVDRTMAASIIKHFTQETYENLIKPIETQRNGFLHARPSWSSGLTTEEHWERLVAIGMTSRLFERDFRHPHLGQRVLAGDFNEMTLNSSLTIDKLGTILTDLEEDLVTNNELRYSLEQ